MSMSGQKTDRLSKQDEAHRIYPKFTISCQGHCTGDAGSVPGRPFPPGKGIPTFLLRHLSQALETLLRRGAFESEPSSMEEG